MRTAEDQSRYFADFEPSVKIVSNLKTNSQRQHCMSSDSNDFNNTHASGTPSESVTPSELSLSSGSSRSGGPMTPVISMTPITTMTHNESKHSSAPGTPSESSESSESSGSGEHSLGERKTSGSGENNSAFLTLVSSNLIRLSTYDADMLIHGLMSVFEDLNYTKQQVYELLLNKQGSSIDGRVHNRYFVIESLMALFKHLHYDGNTVQYLLYEKCDICINCVMKCSRKNEICSIHGCKLDTCRCCCSVNDMDDDDTDTDDD